MIRLGLIGMGGIAQIHAEAIAKVHGFRFVAGADPKRSARDSFAKKYPDMVLYSDHRRLLKEAGVDAAVVCTETLYHKQLTIDVMRSGRPVFVEKPMARTVADAHRMLDVSEKTGQLLMVAHCRRYDRDWGRFAQILKQGRLGRPVLWRSVAAGLGPGSWYMDERIGGGPLIDGAVHNYDFANLIFGQPDSVIASGIKLTQRSAVDTASAVVRYTSGDQLLVSWSWGTRGDGAHDVLGSRASLFFGPGDMKPADDKGGYAYFRIWPHGGERQLIRFRYSALDMYTEQTRHFVACMKGEMKCMSPGSESIKAVAVAEAILAASKTGAARKVRW